MSDSGITLVEAQELQDLMMNKFIAAGLPKEPAEETARLRGALTSTRTSSLKRRGRLPGSFTATTGWANTSATKP